MPVKPEKVGIFITTNIDDKIHEFTKSMIYNPLLRTTSRHYSKYPLTTKDSKFIYDELKSKTYEDIVDFFFDPVLMAKGTDKKTDTSTQSAQTTVKDAVELDKALTMLDASMNTNEFKTKMSTSETGTSPDLTDLHNILYTLSGDLFNPYNSDFKSFIDTNTKSDAGKLIIEMLENRVFQQDFDKLNPTMKGNITKLKKDIRNQINLTINKVIAVLSTSANVDKLNNLTIKKKHDQDIENAHLNTNINMMIYRLFPQTNLSASTFMSFIVRKAFPMHQTFKYSYLKIDGQIYTIVRCNWLKNIFNHPLYRKLFDGMFKYIEWTEDEDKRAAANTGETNSKIIQIIKSCSGTDIYTNNNADYSELNRTLTSKVRGLEKSPGSADYASAIAILIRMLEKLSNANSPQTDIVILSLLSQFSAYTRVQEAINEITVKPLRKYIQDMLKLNMIKDEIDLYEERFFRGSNVDLKYDFPSTVSNKIDNGPIKRIQKLITDDFLPSQRTSTNYEFQSKFEDYLNNNGTEFINYIKRIKGEMNNLKSPEKDPNCKKCGYAIDEEIDINLNVVQGKEYKYEMYVHFDLIKGEVSDANRGIIKCPYVNDKLVDEWNNLRKNIVFPFWEPPKLPFFEVKFAEMKKGGRHGTRYQRKKYNKTRKSRKTFSLEFLHL
jgi:hypothetical protein